MKYLAIIQARFGSTRLPGKILMNLAGKPVLQRVIERVKKSKYMDEVVTVTSIERDDLQTLHFVSGLGERVLAGSENDVLDRYYQCARLFEPEYVVRVTGDCPLFDAGLLDMAVDQMDPKSDYLAAITETLADGLDLEIFRYTALEQSWKDARLASEREHVTLHMRNHPKRYTLQNFESPYGNLNAERWSLDEPEDYELLQKIYTHFDGDDFFDTEDVLEFLDAHPELRKINAAYTRNEGLKKSLQEDYEVRK